MRSGSMPPERQGKSKENDLVEMRSTIRLVGAGLGVGARELPHLANPTEHLRRHVLRVSVVGAGSDCWPLVGGASPRET